MFSPIGLYVLFQVALYTSVLCKDGSGCWKTPVSFPIFCICLLCDVSNLIKLNLITCHLVWQYSGLAKYWFIYCLHASCLSYLISVYLSFFLYYYKLAFICVFVWVFLRMQLFYCFFSIFRLRYFFSAHLSIDRNKWNYWLFAFRCGPLFDHATY